MPSLNLNVTGPVRVADQRGEDYLLVNRESGAWAVSDFDGVSILALGEDALTAALPVPLQRLVGPARAQRPRPNVEPLILIYKLTDKCNYRCSYCYDRTIARPKDATKRSAAVRDMLDRTLPERPVMLLFHGGEPLLEFPEIRDLVLEYQDFCPDRLLFSLQTNVSRLDQAKLDFLVEHQFGLSVSVDGHSPELNELRMIGTRPDPYQLLKDKIRDLHGLRADRLGLLMTVGQHNVHSLTDSLLAFQDDGFKSVSFSFMHAVGPGAVPASPADLTASMLAVIRAITEKRLDSLACMTMIQWVIRVVHGRSGLVCLGSPCGAGRSVATVLANGDVGPCDSIFSDDFFHGDVDAYVRGLETNPNLVQLRTRSVLDLYPCSDCDVRAYCNGTCPGSTVLATGGIQTVDPHECAFYYGLIREMLWILCEPEAGPQLISYCERHLAEKKAYGF